MQTEKQKKLTEEEKKKICDEKTMKDIVDTLKKYGSLWNLK